MNFDERGYLSDPYTIDFFAVVREVEPLEDETYAVYLDRTFFYPESGGQPDDRGTLGGRSIIEVTEDERGVRHVMDGELERGGRVEGHVEWSRRFDHMQQHSGQHLLSRVFLRELGLRTVGFHLGERTCTIDLAGDVPSQAAMKEIESHVNELIWRNVPVADRIVGKEEYERMQEGEEKPAAGEMRSRLPDGVKQVRIVEIADIDNSTCCGTHTRATGEIGIMKILGPERVKGNCRVEFICGGRALRDYGERKQTLDGIALSFSADWRELGKIIEKLSAENRTLRKKSEELKSELAGFRAAELTSPGVSIAGVDLVRKVFDESDTGALRDMALKIKDEGGKVVLFGVRAPKPGLIFSCSPDVSLDMGAVMKASAPVMGARGGGGRDFAQGGGGDGGRIDEALDRAEKDIREVLE